MPIFFRCGSGRAPCVPGNVCCLHFHLRVHQRGCTKPLVRCSRRRDDECTDARGWSLRPRNFSVPSSRPRQSGGCTPGVRQGGSGAAAGPHTTTGPAVAVSRRAGADVQSKGRAQGRGPLGSSTCATQGHRHDRARPAGSSRDRPVRRRAHPFRALGPREKFLQRKRWGAFQQRGARPRELLCPPC